MKANIKLLTFIGFVVILSLTFCKKKEAEPAPDTRTKTQLITASEWKWTLSTCNVPVDLDLKDGASTDLLSQMPPCQIDDTYTYKLDSTTIEKTNVKCKTSEPAAWKGTWIFTNGEKNLQWNGIDYTLLELSGSKLMIKYTLVTGPNTYLITDTYTH